MLTTAVIFILVVQNHLLCERKVQELKKANFSTFLAISPETSNLLNTFFYESIVQRVNFRSGSIYCQLSWLLWPSYYFCFCCCFLCVMEIATKKNNLWHCSCCHKYVDKQNKPYQRLHQNIVYMDFSLKVCQIYSVPFTMILILYFQYGCPCLVIMYLIQNNSYLLELSREYFDDLWLKWNSYFKSKNYIQWPVSLMIIVIEFIQIYLVFIWVTISNNLE